MGLALPSTGIDLPVLKRLVERVEPKLGEVEMSDKELARFFELMEKIVNELPGSFGEKKVMIEEAAKNNGAETAFEEFLAWFGGDTAGD